MKMKSVLISGASIAAAGALFMGASFAVAQSGAPIVSPSPTVVTSTATASPEATVTLSPTPTATTTPTATASPTPTATTAPAPAPTQSTATSTDPTAGLPVGTTIVLPPAPCPTYVPANPQPRNVPPGFTATLNGGAPYDPVTNPNPAYIIYETSNSCNRQGFFATGH